MDMVLRTRRSAGTCRNLGSSTLTESAAFVVAEALRARRCSEIRPATGSDTPDVCDAGLDCSVAGSECTETNVLARPPSDAPETSAVSAACRGCVVDGTRGGLREQDSESGPSDAPAKPEP